MGILCQKLINGENRNKKSFYIEEVDFQEGNVF